jgi:very-short-patch-repair endonuclease
MSDILEIKSGELYIHGNHIPRHEEKPWLFSASAVHKALEEVIRKKARSKKKDEDTYFYGVRPAAWASNNFKKEEYVEKIANRTRNRIRKFGLAVGFGLHCEPTMTYTVEDIEDFEDQDLVYSGIKGHGKKSGTYLCLEALTDYVLVVDPTLADDFHKHGLLEISSIKKAHEVAITERLEYQFAFHLEIIAESFNYKLSTQVSVLQYYLDFLLKSPKGKYIVIEYDEHYHKAQVEKDNERILNVVNHLKKHKKIPQGLTVLRCKQGEEKKFLVELSKKLQGKVSSLPSQEFIS